MVTKTIELVSISPQSYYFTIWILSKIDLLIKNSLFKNVYKEGGLNQGGFWAMTFHAVVVLCFSFQSGLQN